MTKMTATELVSYAVRCAIRDRQTFAECWSDDAPERAEALDEVRQFRAYLKRRFGSAESRMEINTEGATLVTLDELRKRGNA